ncbi:alpha/beta hydrolase-fold protein [Cereibacter sp. SYSU M97828]|nr:alpha/beta hydrolase-fold protein [Cereibacter flavus]
MVKRLAIALTMILSLAGAGTVQEDAKMRSTVLRQGVGYAVYLPPGYEEDSRAYPVIYLLHGAVDGQPADWFRFVAIDRLLDRLIAEGRIPPVIAIAPDGRRNEENLPATYFLDDADGGFEWERMFITEFVPYVERRYRAIVGTEARMMLGISMGGFAATVYQLRYPDMFGGAAVLSGAFRTDTEMTQMAQPPYERRFAGAFGAGLEGEARLNEAYRRSDPVAMAATAQTSQQMGFGFWFDIGADDPFFAGNAAMHIALRDAGIAHRFRVGHGKHDWQYWDDALEPALLFLSDRMRRRE